MTLYATARLVEIPRRMAGGYTRHQLRWVAACRVVAALLQNHLVHFANLVSPKSTDLKNFSIQHGKAFYRWQLWHPILDDAN